MSEPLKSPQQEKFAQCVAKGMTQADAYREAYPTSKKWTDKALYPRASELAADSKVIARINALKAPALREMEITIEKIIRENAWIAFSDVRELFDENGNTKNPKDWPDHLAHAVQSIEVQEIGGGDNPVTVIKKIKFWEKGPALDRMFKHAGLYAKDNEQKVPQVKSMLEEIINIGRGLPTRKPITVNHNDD